jgi:ABC-type branched-subunit amino acid transport system ATPase component
MARGIVRHAARLSGTSTLLSVEDLTVRYGGTYALEGVSFTLGRSERLGIIGPNGAGKSTLLKVVAGDLRPTSGRILLGGRPIGNSPPWKRARWGLVRTRQELGLFASMTVLENICCGADCASGAARQQAEAVASAPSVEEIMEILALTSWRHEVVESLPYGIRKLTELARALATCPAVLMLDEPVAGLNTAEKQVMVERLDAAVEHLGAALILVEHDMQTVAAVCPDQAIAMVAGRVAATGAFQQVVTTDTVVEAYFGSQSPGKSVPEADGTDVRMNGGPA